MPSLPLPLVLGSASPRRAEILQFFTLPFEIVPSHFEEESIPWLGEGSTYVEQLSHSKAALLSTQHPDRLILCADTAVCLGDRVFNKPSSPEEAKAMLRSLSGQCHSVWTGVSLYQRGHLWTGSQETKIYLKPLSEEQIHLYQTSLHTLDKAGGYAVQGAGSMIVERIEGCFYNAMGLPLQLTHDLLQQAGINLWHYLG